MQRDGSWRWSQSHHDTPPWPPPATLFFACYLWSFENNTCYWVPAQEGRVDVVHARARYSRPVSLPDLQSKHTETSSSQRQLREILQGVLFTMFEKLKKVRNEASATSFYPFIHPVFTVVVSRLISWDPNKAAINCASMHSTGSDSVCVRVWGGVQIYFSLKLFSRADRRL